MTYIMVDVEADGPIPAQAHEARMRAAGFYGASTKTGRGYRDLKNRIAELQESFALKTTA